MYRTLITGIAGGTLALALVGGAIFANASNAAQTAAPQAQATAIPSAPGQPAAPVPPGERRGPGFHKGGAGALMKDTADVTGKTHQEVVAALQAGKSLAQYAQENGKTADQVIQAARSEIKGRLDQAVTSGRLTQAQADQLLAEFDSSAQQIVNDTTLGQQVGRGGPGGPGGRGDHGDRGAGGLIQATATVTGLSVEEVRAQLQVGKSLAQVAQENGKTADDILAQLRSEGEQRLNEQLDRARDLLNQPGLSGQPQSPPATDSSQPTT